MTLLAGRYRVGASIGRGCSSVVHHGFDRSLRRPVAIKMMTGLTADGVHTALAEAQAAARLSHPNVARVYDFGEAGTGDGKAPFLVLEYLSGGTLADRLLQGPLPFVEAAAVAADVAAALAAVHAYGLVHRDIKPRNVMVGPAGAKLVDFGVAAAAGEKPVDADGRIWGTPAYSAPEQLRGEQSHPSADVYALGVLLHECLTGSSPWQGSTPEHVLVNRHLKPVPTLPNPDDYPAGFADFYEGCVSPRPGKRPTAHEAARALRNFTTGRSEPEPPARRSVSTWTSRPRVIAAACGAAAAVIVGIAVADHGPTDAGEVSWMPPAAGITTADDISSPSQE
ncbi:serine/threonine-protein kinase [Actinoplanes solisilvae]|uniref:serine/threonine-protein kinase n=1 Tax=Actinoplanes solisilvae TaxID=2486853 RepID=UPI0013E311CA|nr:serine/threonine-protein kinase [Actinoplanes solisilvae]